MEDVKQTFYGHTLGQIPGTVVYVGEKNTSDLFIDVFNYDKESYEEKELKNIEEAYSFIDSEPITWINVNGLNHIETIEKLGGHCNLHPLILEV